ncbi:MAG TPA: hypothetical protein DEB09_03300 [Candidatus Magasanikbacteria bacterium]|nr:hypothetical protein [Candidatus Magasanikbacteria bacterium]
MQSFQLYIIYGASGVGKSMITKMVKSFISDLKITIHRKDTTRSPRKGESKSGTDDLGFVKKMSNNKYAVIYNYCGHKYGVRNDLLNKAFMDKAIHFIIVADIQAIKKLKLMYPMAKVIFVHADYKEMSEKIRQADTLDWKKRKVRAQSIYKNFIKYNTLFDYVILNFWDIDKALQQLKNIIKYNGGVKHILKTPPILN